MKLETTGGLRARVERWFLPGMGCCYRCRRPWRRWDPLAVFAVTAHMTSYSSDRRCFPLCEDCWQKLDTATRRLPYYRALWESWMEPRVDWEVFRQAVYREAGEDELPDDDPFDPPAPTAAPLGPRQRLSPFASRAHPLK